MVESFGDVAVDFVRCVCYDDVFVMIYLCILIGLLSVVGKGFLLCVRGVVGEVGVLGFVLSMVHVVCLLNVVELDYVIEVVFVEVIDCVFVSVVCVIVRVC